MGDRILHNLMPILKVILFIFFILLCLLPVGIISRLAFIHFDKDSIGTDLFLEGSLVLVVLGALLMMFKVLPAVNFSNVFLVKKDALSGFLKGTTIGFVLIAICGALLLATGNVQFTVGNINILYFVAYIIYFLFVALFEEMMFRTFPLLAFAERYPVLVTVVINGLLFGFVHMGNPGFTWLAMLNITLAGILFSVFTLLKKNISWAIGIHFGWNFTQGILLGYKVSGINTPSTLVAKPIGENYISGGVFGIEGSVVCTIILAILIVWLLMKNNIVPITVVKDNIEEIG